MNAVAPVTFFLDAEGIGWIVFDAPDARANVFNLATQQALGTAIDAAAASTAQAIVLCGNKERIFIAGADLRWLQALPDAPAAVAFSRAGQKLFQRLADLSVPVICAIHGACAGGGFELALACDWRLASDAAATQVGLPETGIGTIPGWGGCARLPRLLGLPRAVDHILRGQLLPASEALRVGLVDEVVPATDLRARAGATALRLATTGKPRRGPVPASPKDYLAQVRETTLRQTRGQLPAPLAALNAIEQGEGQSLAQALEIEARYFGDVTAGAACKNLIHVFFLREAAKKRTLDGWFEHEKGRTEVDAAVPPIRRVGVVGAGVMGSGIAHWLASRGFDVVLRDVRPEFVERGLSVIRHLLSEGVKRGKCSETEAAAVLGKIRSTTGWDGFAECDVVIEAIVENVAEKRKLFSELAEVVRPEALLASNTSALPIDEIAGHVPHPARIVGIHFFNPVSRMPLVELILGDHTTAPTAARALALVRALGKTPVICRSRPGFIVTRVLFFYLNAAVRWWESGFATDSIDSALRDFGWPMGPLRLIDEVGLDVTTFIFRELAHYYPERFVATTTCDRLLAAGLTGRKNGASRGFYRYENGTEFVNDAETRKAVAPAGEGGAPPDQVGRDPSDVIATELMQVMIDEARRCVSEGVALSADDVDFALLSGAGFPAFRGGLLRWAGAVQ